MKSTLTTLLLALALNAPAFSSQTQFNLDCTKGESADACKAEWYDVAGGQPSYFKLTCTDGSIIHKFGVSTPHTGLQCVIDDYGESYYTYVCDADGKKYTYDVKGHLQCK
ncbi:MAG: hypothetical protein AAGI44_07540 [Pseudomonadota bacterium]